ncbi:MAG: integrase arm-type DNA-binding domain-containing protein [Caulobacteraceae bacterium]|nr:integrase arm-type DNA-binding domain-containing protein [Caulobacteraceae bacterium]
MTKNRTRRNASSPTVRNASTSRLIEPGILHLGQRRKGKTFELKYRAGRRQRLFVIGDYGPFTAEKARKAAEDAKHNASRGGDPQHEKEVRRNAATIAELIQLYLTEGRIDKPEKRESSWRTDERDLRCHVEPLLGAHSINALTTPDISRWQRDVANFKTARTQKLGFRRKSTILGGPKVVGRATRTLCAMLNWAIKRELIKDNPAARGQAAGPAARALSHR